METLEKKSITVETTIKAPVEKVWSYWTNPEHITRWCQASDDWHAPYSENDLKVNGKFKTTMAARDGSASFDFEGIYTQVQLNKLIAYIILDGRKVTIAFSENDDQTKIVETFETENENSAEVQRDGWQAILDNFRKYVESSVVMEKLHFEIEINAPAEKVYHKMLDKDTYKQWTSVFAPDSHFTGSWEKGSKIIFLGTDENGETGGMVSRIKDNIPNKFVSIEHQGMVQDGKEITSGKAIEGWAGAHENYTFIDLKGRTLLCIDTDSTRELKDLFLTTWPLALEKLKELCEE
jgi:uncharacterized protein YndB with AHSA1/START domain